MRDGTYEEMYDWTRHEADVLRATLCAVEPLLEELMITRKMGHEWCPCCRQYDGEHLEDCMLKRMYGLVRETLNTEF